MFGRGSRASETGESAPQRLATLGERRIDHREDLLAARSTIRPLRSLDANESRVDIRFRPKHPGGDIAGISDAAIPSRFHARNAVDLRPGRGGQPLGHLLLHHDERRLQRRKTLKEGEEHRNGDVVGQVRDEGVDRIGAAADGLPIDLLDAAGRTAVAALIADGLVDGRAALDGRVVLSRRGRLLADLVVRRLIG